MWKTPNQLLHVTKRLGMGRAIEHEDAGFWVTCVRGSENKAISEILELCDKV
jgi:hypothetical protein